MLQDNDQLAPGGLLPENDEEEEGGKGKDKQGGKGKGAKNKNGSKKSTGGNASSKKVKSK